jgi:hypothetical protein
MATNADFKAAVLGTTSPGGAPSPAAGAGASPGLLGSATSSAQLIKRTRSAYPGAAASPAPGSAQRTMSFRSPAAGGSGAPPIALRSFRVVSDSAPLALKSVKVVGDSPAAPGAAAAAQSRGFL